MSNTYINYSIYLANILTKSGENDLSTFLNLINFKKINLELTDIFVSRVDQFINKYSLFIYDSDNYTDVYNRLCLLNFLCQFDEYYSSVTEIKNAIQLI